MPLTVRCGTAYAQIRLYLYFLIFAMMARKLIRQVMCQNMSKQVACQIEDDDADCERNVLTSY